MFNPYDYDFTDAIETITNLFETPAGRKFIVSPTYQTFHNMMRSYDDCELWDAHGATKGVVGCGRWDFVIKLPFKEDIDYCAIEVANYNASKEYDCSHMMAWTIRLDRIYGMPIYAQEYVECNEEDVQDSVSKKAYEQWIDEGKPCDEDTIKEEGYNMDDEADAQEYFYEYEYDSCAWEEWDGVGTLFEDDYTEKEMRALNNWIDNVGCCDLHSGNVGYKDDVIVLVDFSGYCMNWWLKEHNWDTMHKYY